MIATKPRAQLDPPTPAATDPRPQTEYPDAVRMALVAIAVVGVGFFLCHLPYGRLATVSLSLAGAALAGLSLLGLERRAWLGWAGIGLNAVFVLLLVGFPAQLDLAGWWPARATQTPAQAPGVSADGWVDAGEAAWEADGVQVALVFAMVCPDPDNSNRGGTAPFLWIGAKVTNTGARTVDFAGWDATTPGGPLLTTASGTSVAGRRGQSAPAKLAPGQSAECLLAFDVPPTGQAVRLELPANVYGGTNSARFQIAPELIGRK